MRTKIYRASLDQLHDMLHWIRKEAEQCGFQTKGLYQLELASEEVIVNVIQHSYKNREGEIEITIDAVPNQMMTITFVDTGEPFNPLPPIQENKLDTPLEEREPGGLGLLFIRNCVDEAHYQRHNHRNQFILIKKVLKTQKN